MKTWRRVVLLAGLLAVACRSGGHPSPPPGVVLARLSVTSKAFTPNGAIPVDYTCDGADHSPPRLLP